MYCGFYLVDKKTKEYFELGGGIDSRLVFIHTLNNPKILIDAKSLVEVLYGSNDYVHRESIPWISDRLHEFLADRDEDNLKIISDDDIEYGSEDIVYPKAGSKGKVMGSIWPEDYLITDNGEWIHLRKVLGGEGWAELKCSCDYLMELHPKHKGDAVCPRCQRVWGVHLHPEDWILEWWIPWRFDMYPTLLKDIGEPKCKT